ncbi:MAG TPA: transaldolase family protein, partial [Mycobacteriales bacterium]|nr:transaldolase family protein [Mycobacteriales bacterium]
AGRDLSTLRSVASFFVSRVDTEVDARLAKIDSPQAAALAGTAAIANARIAYRRYEAVCRGERWTALAATGAHPQRPLWASTSTKNPAYDDTRYVTQLVGSGVVNTMPEPTLNAVLDHGEIRPDSVRHGDPDPQAVLDALQDVGVNYDDVVQTLEDEGLAKFIDSWTALEGRVQTRLKLGHGA